MNKVLIKIYIPGFSFVSEVAIMQWSITDELSMFLMKNSLNQIMSKYVFIFKNIFILK